MKVVKITITLLVSLLLIAIAGLEAYYYYKIYEIAPKKVTSQINHPQVIKEALWSSLGEVDKIQLESYSATEYITRFIVGANFYDFSEFNTVLPHGTSLSYLTARQIALGNDRTPLHGHLNNTILSIWVSRNYTPEEAFDYILNNMYFGYGLYGTSKSSKFYFNKNLSDLNYSEMVTLIGLSNSPSRYSPYCNISRLIKRSEMIDARLKVFNQTSYSGVTYKVPGFIVNSQVKCK